MKNNDLLFWIQEWFDSNCTDKSGNQHQIHIITIDNPGWGITINLKGTNLENCILSPVINEISGENWYHCKSDGEKFYGDGGPKNFGDILKTFRDWAEQKKSYYNAS